MSAFESLYGGQFTLLAQLIKPNYKYSMFRNYITTFDRGRGLEGQDKSKQFSVRNLRRLLGIRIKSFVSKV